MLEEYVYEDVPEDDEDDVQHIYIYDIDMENEVQSSGPVEEEVSSTLPDDHLPMDSVEGLSSAQADEQVSSGSEGPVDDQKGGGGQDADLRPEDIVQVEMMMDLSTVH